MQAIATAFPVTKPALGIEGLVRVLQLLMDVLGTADEAHDGFPW